MINTRIAHSFNRAYLSYDQHCQVQTNINHKLIELLIPFMTPKQIIVDLGCGTGNSTLALYKTFLPEKIYALDLADRLLNLAQTKETHNNLIYIKSNFEDSIFQENSVNLIYSNMALQWGYDLLRIFQIIFTQLKPKGLFAFSLPLLGTFSELHSKNNFFTFQKVEDLFKKTNFKILTRKKIIYQERFSTAVELLQSIKKCGANFVTHNRQSNGLRRRSLSEFFLNEDEYNLTYEIGFFIAEKKEYHG